MKSFLKNAVIIILCLWGCASACQAHTANPYYPMAVGNRWEYLLEAADKNIHRRHEYLVLDCLRENGSDVFVVRGSLPDAGITYDNWIEVTGDGDVIFKAEDSIIMILAIDFEPWVILPGNPTEAGMTWKRVLEQHYEDYPDSTFHSVTQSTLEAENETITVPAGTFYGCIKILIEEYDPWKNHTGTSHKWFAPGVGLVKMVVDFPADKLLTQVLVAYEVK